MPRQMRTTGPVSRAAADTYDAGVITRSARLADVEALAGDAQQHLVAVDVTIDLVAQTFTGVATLAAAPTTSDAALGIVAGTWNGKTCTAGFIAATATVTGGPVANYSDQVPVALTSSVAGNQITLRSAPDARLRSSAFDCAYALVLSNDASATPLSRAYPEDLVETYRPVLAVSAASKMVGAKSGKWATVSVDVDNTSRSAATGVVLTATGAGIQVSAPTTTIGGIAERDDAKVVLKVRLTPPKKTKKKPAKAKSPQRRTLTLTASGTGATTVSTTTEVVITPKPTKLKKLKGTYWWGFQPSSTSDSSGWVNHAAWFVDNKWAFLGWAEGAKPKCSAKVKECVKYSYNPRRGVVKLGKQRIKVDSAGFTFKHPGYSGKLAMYPLTLPKKGTKFGVDLFRQDWSGYCLITCTTFTDYLTMDPAGQFVESGSSIGSWPGLGTSWATVSADQKGTYKVVATGIVELAYADGTKKRHVIGIEHDLLGKPNAAVAGVLLGGTNYYD